MMRIVLNCCYNGGGRGVRNQYWEDDPAATRMLIMDNYGNVYGTDDGRDARVIIMM